MNVDTQPGYKCICEGSEGEHVPNSSSVITCAYRRTQNPPARLANKVFTKLSSKVY